MPTREKDGTYRTRKKTPGYGSGTLIMRLGTRDERTAEQREGLLMELYKEGFFDVIDALRAKKFKFPEALKILKTGGLPALRERARGAPVIAAGTDAYAEAAAWRKSREGRYTRKQVAAAYKHVLDFLDWLKVKSKGK